MSAHRGMAPLEIRNCVTDADKEENLLRTRFLYVKGKAELTYEVCGLVARIEKLTQTDPDKELVIAVETWLAVHDNVLPQEYKHATDHVELNECMLGQRYRSLKRRKAELTTEVREIMERIEIIKQPVKRTSGFEAMQVNNRTIRHQEVHCEGHRKWVRTRLIPEWQEGPEPKMSSPKGCSNPYHG
jgi:hypothetical protein